MEARIAEMLEYIDSLQKQINELEKRVDCLESPGKFAPSDDELLSAWCDALFGKRE
jgi:hypothetical protein